MATINTVIERGFVKQARMEKFAAMIKEAGRRFLDDAQLKEAVDAAKTAKRKRSC